MADGFLEVQPSRGMRFQNATVLLLNRSLEINPTRHKLKRYVNPKIAEVLEWSLRISEMAGQITEMSCN
jgi:hypothetical protein